ncbi:hypothetical protein P20439_2639 [Pseudoalteromonas sp. BSi20439]|nr:hypothetical protein P20439_2639 [Pseudoalteromonas sp. BSi20439]
MLRNITTFKASALKPVNINLILSWDCKAHSDYFYKRSFNRPLKIDKPIF